jgi:lysine-N-methylase
MSWPVRHLPVLQNWDCQGCTDCCREYRVYLSEEDRRRLAEQDWEQDSEAAGRQWEVPEGWGRSLRYHLKQRADGCCIFLSEQGRCRIHERYGGAAKPFACRLYPFILVPAGDHWRVSLRYACPAAAQNQGKPLPEHAGELADYAAEMEREEKLAGRTIAPPALQPGQCADWSDLFRFVETLSSILCNRNDRLERRWRKCLTLAALCRQAKFDEIKGHRLQEFLELVASGLDTEAPADPSAVAAPSWIGRVLFRQALAVLVRKDVGAQRGPATQSRLALLAAARRFATGRGPVPRIHALLPETTFQELETPLGPLSAEAELLLERYYLVKVSSLQFCGPANFGLPFWRGLESLALTFPAILWLIRAFGTEPREAGAARAVSMVDHNFAYSPHLGGRFQRLALRLLAQRGELEKLIAWYSC